MVHLLAVFFTSIASHEAEVTVAMVDVPLAVLLVRLNAGTLQVLPPRAAVVLACPTHLNAKKSAFQKWANQKGLRRPK